MINIQVPEILTKHKQLKHKDFSFVYYNEYKPVGRNLISFSKYAVSFILSGQKELYRGAECMLLGDQDVVLIPSGNAIIAERTLRAEKYSSLVVFFSPELVEDFLIKHALRPHISQLGNNVSKSSPFLKFHQTAYIDEYISALIHLIDKQISVHPNLLLHKLEELFLILLEKFPREFFQIFTFQDLNRDNIIRQIVENNILSNLTLKELAFLSHRSLAKFKRDFEKEYGISPGKYMRERKLDVAMHSIQEGKAVHNIALHLGYDNVSNFIMAFKKRFGQTPKSYQPAS